MNKQNSPIQQKPTPNESAAGLALATHISQQLTPKNPMQQGQNSMQAPQSPETAPGQPQTPQEQQSPTQPQNEPQEPKENEQITALTKDIAEFKGNIEGMINTKFDALTKTITDAIK